MAYTPFAVNRPGVEHGRIFPQLSAPVDGDAIVMLGVESPGWTDRDFAIGDKVEASQSDSKGTADVVRFSNRVRAPSEMPALSSMEPFGLADGQTLQLAIDGGAVQTITFNTADFAVIGAARATEVAQAISAALAGASAAQTGRGRVVIRSATTGRHSRVEVVGGTATALGFVELAWHVQFLINGTVIAQKRMLTGEVREFSDWTANLAAYADPVEIKFRLVLGVVA